MSGIITKIFQNYYKLVSGTVIKTMDATLEDIEKETLTADKLVSRSAKLMLDSSNGVWGALLQSGAAPLPVIVCSTEAGNAQAGGSTVVPLMDGPKLVSTQLFKVGGGDPLPKDSAHVDKHIKLTVDKFELSVLIVGLNMEKPGKGYYVASVTNTADGNRVVAEITLTIV